MTNKHLLDSHEVIMNFNKILQNSTPKQIADMTNLTRRNKAIPIKYFVSHRPTDPFFFKKSKKKKIQIH